jgi:hypothetical protein
VSSRRAVSTPIFAATILVLVIVAAAGFGLYVTKPSSTEMMTETSTNSMTATMTTGASTEPTAIPFVAASGQMFSGGWLVVGMTQSGQYLLSIHAGGLEATNGSDYIVEGTQSSGSMATLPIGPNATSSEFDAGSNGVGNFIISLNQNPLTTYESVQIFLLPGMQMTNETLVATATLTMASH